MKSQPFADEIRKLHIAIGELRKPVSVAKAEQRLMEARREQSAAQEKLSARLREVRAAAATVDVDGRANEMKRKLDACEARVGEARREHQAALRKWEPQAGTEAQQAVEQSRELIDQLLDAIEQSTAPIARFADHCVTSGIIEPAPAQKVRKIWQHVYACRKLLGETVVKQMRVRFMCNYVVNEGTAEEQRYQAGKIYDLREDSARRCMNRGYAIPADEQYVPAPRVKVRFLEQSIAGAHMTGDAIATYAQNQTVELPEPQARMWVERGAAVPVDETLWETLWGGIKAAVAEPATEPAIEARRGPPRAKVV